MFIIGCTFNLFFTPFFSTPLLLHRVRIIVNRKREINSIFCLLYYFVSLSSLFYVLKSSVFFPLFILLCRGVAITCFFSKIEKMFSSRAAFKQIFLFLSHIHIFSVKRIYTYTHLADVYLSFLTVPNRTNIFFRRFTRRRLINH